MRKLARIEIIEAVEPIVGADLIQAYFVGGWWVVGQKSSYQVGQKVTFCEIDSWIPHLLAPFLSKGKAPREFEGIQGERLRTIRLKGQLSQGLMIPLEECAAYVSASADTDFPSEFSMWNSLEVGTDVSEYLGILKWEAPVNVNMQGVARGNFPSWGRKTDQERIQNLQREFQRWYDADILWEVTIKMDGSSMSVGRSPEGEYTVCSRNLMLETDQEGNSFVNCAKALELDKFTEVYHQGVNPLHKGFLIQGELCGEGIQGNQEGITGHQFFVYDIYVTEIGGYLNAKARQLITSAMRLNHVPVLHQAVTLRELGLDTVQKVLDFAEGKSWNEKVDREGVVFKSLDGKYSFKAIANNWLLKNQN